MENIGFIGILQNMHLRLQFHRYHKINDFISFTTTRSRTSHSNFFEFLNNKILKNIKKCFLNVTFFRLCCVFLVERDRKPQNYVSDGLGNPIPYKMMFCFSHLRQKLLLEKMHF